MSEDQLLLSELFISWLPMLIILGVFWFVPLFVIGKSNKVGKNEKLAWILATLFVSWLSFIIYLLLAPLKPNDK
ncbi:MULTISPECIES: PLDc N-terminal domain-containing protein [unclassified Alteromonas]|jgi:polyferredoxin|nr:MULTISPECIES: PLDc N-terminal domain-containing protein [unclassified Alteromonas]